MFDLYIRNDGARFIRVDRAQFVDVTNSSLTFEQDCALLLLCPSSLTNAKAASIIPHSRCIAKWDGPGLCTIALVPSPEIREYLGYTAVITHVCLFANGMVMVFDQYGVQMPEYQGRCEVVKAKIDEIFTGEWEVFGPRREVEYEQD